MNMTYLKRFVGAGFVAIGVATAMFLAGCDAGTSAMAESSANVTRVRGPEFEAQVLKASSPVVVDFYATWCGPCKRLSPMLDAIAGSYTNKVKFVKVDVDEATELTKKYEIEGMPTLLFFKNGEVVDRMLGLPTADELKRRIASLAGSES